MLVVVIIPDMVVCWVNLDVVELVSSTTLLVEEVPCVELVCEDAIPVFEAWVADVIAVEVELVPGAPVLVEDKASVVEVVSGGTTTV